jgi:hypothetical protein
MNNLVQKFKEHVIEASNGNADFIHRDWFVQYHLEIVEKIALELCEKYPAADKEFVRLMVWLHDYGKIFDFPNQYAVTLTAGKAKLLELGFSEEIAQRAVDYIEVLDKKEGLASEATPLEIKIVSSADGCSHLVGPFFYLWWYENANKPYPELMEDNIRKLAKDWDKKIVLPEAIEAFKNRHDLLLEQTGKIPERLLP